MKDSVKKNKKVYRAVDIIIVAPLDDSLGNNKPHYYPISPTVAVDEMLLSGSD